METQSTPERDYYTVKEFSALTAFHEQTVRDWIWSGRLEAYYFGRHIRIPRKAVEEFRTPVTSGEVA